MTPIDPTTLETIRAGADLMSGLCRLLLAHARRLEGDPSPGESDAPAEGPEMLGSELRCIIEDTLNPGSQALRKLASAWDAEPGDRRCGKGSGSATCRGWP